jgi:glycosyltransferase involved in cell wall biosynthesis
MRILSFTYEYPPIGGGGSAVASSLNETLVAQGHSVDVVTSGMLNLPQQELVQGVNVHRFRCWRRYRYYSTIAELATTLIPSYRLASQLIAANRPDIIHTHFVFPSGVVAYWLSQRFGIPYVLTAHGSDVPGYNPDRFEGTHRLLQPVWRHIIRNAAALVSPSQFLAHLIRRNIDIEGIRIIPNGYMPAPAQAQLRRKMILVVSRMFPRKGVQHFITSLCGMQTDWEVVIAGDGPHLDALKDLAARNGVSIRFTGFIDKVQLRALYEQAGILVCPSTRENFPVVLLEGMDAGCAIITTDAPGCTEAIGDAGVIVEAGNPTQIRAAIQMLMKDEDKRATLSQRALDRSSAFRWSAIAEAYMSVFDFAAGSGTARAGDELSDTIRTRRLKLIESQSSGPGNAA